MMNSEERVPAAPDAQRSADKIIPMKYNFVDA
jgi:hypothetical protein